MRGSHGTTGIGDRAGRVRILPTDADPSLTTNGRRSRDRVFRPVDPIHPPPPTLDSSSCAFLLALARGWAAHPRHVPKTSRCAGAPHRVRHRCPRRPCCCGRRSVCFCTSVGEGPCPARHSSPAEDGHTGVIAALVFRPRTCDSVLTELSAATAATFTWGGRTRGWLLGLRTQRGTGMRTCRASPLPRTLANHRPCRRLPSPTAVLPNSVWRLGAWPSRAPEMPSIHPRQGRCHAAGPREGVARLMLSLTRGWRRPAHACVTVHVGRAVL